jgi:hypothetical protein
MDSVSVSKISPDIGRSPRSFHSSGNIAREKDSGQLRSARAIDRAARSVKAGAKPFGVLTDASCLLAGYVVP